MAVKSRLAMPSSSSKDVFGHPHGLVLGCLIFAFFTACDACSTLIFRAPNQVPLLWIAVTNMGTSIGYLHVQPVAIALFATRAPPSAKGMMIGIYFLSMFSGSLISGRLGALYEQWSATNFWLLHAAIIGVAGLLFPVVGRSLRRTHTERRGPLPAPGA